MCSLDIKRFFDFRVRSEQQMNEDEQGDEGGEENICRKRLVLGFYQR